MRTRSGGRDAGGAGSAFVQLSDFALLSFDCYGTLIDWERGLLDALRPLLARHGLLESDEAILAAFAAAEAAAQARSPGKRYPEILGDALETMAAGWSIPLDPSERARFGASVGDWPAFPDSADALAYLERHFRLAILSNVDRASFARSKVKLGVAFDHVYTAEDIGSYKPDLRNFRYLLDRLAEQGIRAEQVLHVAQSLFHDHVPAQQLGLRTVWINRRSGKTGSGATLPAQARPDLEVPSLAALVQLYRRERGEA